MRGRDDLGMIGEAEIVIRTEIDDGARFAAVVDHRARVSRREKFRLVKLHRPCASAHPFGESGRSLQRIASLASEKITETEFCRILVHLLMGNARLGGFPYRGSYSNVCG